jgi:hypothetical protein
VVSMLVGGDSMLSTATISWDGRGNSTTVESTILRENFRPGSGVIKNGYSSLTGTGKVARHPSGTAQSRRENLATSRLED